MSLQSGTRLGPYEIVTKVGEGGMGQVYRARDTRLDRDVALKVLPDSFSNDPDRLSRFQREAKVLASLNHPNIAHIHGLEESNGVRALVMELVEGEDLAERLARGALPLDEALPIAKQIAEAVETAHDQGIIHRDLKPANIKLRTDGTVKVLDFGLAKALDAPASSPDVSRSPTITTPAMTQAGMVLGTAAYMSPEQARGRAVDKRADIWAFGCVLFEMLAGARAFPGEDVTDTIIVLATRDPDWNLLPPTTPSSLRMLLARCLKKDPRVRLRDIGEARVLIEELRGGTTIEPVTAENASQASTVPPRSTRSSVVVPWAVAAALAGALLGGVLWQYALKTQTLPVVARLTIDLPDQLGQPAGYPPPLAVSPDGRLLVFNAQSTEGVRLWLRPINGQTATSLAGTDDASAPFWAPDSRQIGFISGTRVRRINVETGVIETIADFFKTTGFSGSGNASATWSPDGQTILIALGPGSGIFRVSVRSGDVSKVSAVPSSEGNVSRPEFLGDSDHFAYLANTANAEAAVYTTSLSGAGPTLLMKGLSEVRFVSPGWLVFNKERALIAQRFDPTRLALIGEPTAIADNVDFTGPSASAFSVSDVLVYRTAGLLQTRFTWFGRNGSVLSTPGEPDTLFTMMLSPDAHRLVFGRRQPTGVQNLWVLDLDRNTTSRLTFGSGIDSDGTWSPDGQRIVFASVRDGKKNLYEISSNGEGERLLLASKGPQISMDAWSPDGRFIVYHTDQTREMWAMPMTGDDRTPVLIVKSMTGRVDEPAFSPDSKWISYNINDTGRHEIYVKRFPPTDAKWQVSRDGGVQARWRHDGRELYFLAPDGGMMAVDVSLGETPSFGQPHKLFDTRLAFSFQTDQYAVTPDGQRFLIMNPLSDRKLPPFNVVMNWKSLLPH